MFKRILLIGVLAFSLIALLQTQAMAWSFDGGGWAWGTYEASYVVKGGGPDLEGVFLASEVYVEDAALVCVNPGNWKQDVRVGKGGITLIGVTPGDEFEQIGKRFKGRFNVTEEFNSSIIEWAKDRYEGGQENCDPTEPLADIIEYCPLAVEDFNGFYGVDETHCRNPNWTPYEFLIKKLILTGTLLTGCDPYPPYCDEAADIVLSCETDESYRKWGDGKEKIVYECTDITP